METNQRKNRRVELQTKLEEILGSKNVYFEPPENIKMKYPCIVYEVGAGLRTPADNKKYLYSQGYSVTYITKDPDTDIPDKLLDLQYCSLERPFKSENLYHWVFFIYY
jgi:hypothetical protein